MSKTLLRYIFFITFLILIQSISNISFSQTENSKVSILTCEAGEEVYSMFGHTAIRYEDKELEIDVVYNYGMFDFNAPNFRYRFASGQTDYMLARTSFESFERSYLYYRRRVWQQELVLDLYEKRKLIRLLETNCRPENRVYRYNFFFDNCATKVVDRIEESIDGRLFFDDKTGNNFRDMIYKYCGDDSWNSFGMNLCLGIEADNIMTEREKMFVPIELMNRFETIKRSFSNDSIGDMCKNRVLVVDISPLETSKNSLITPIVFSLILFSLIIAISVYEIKKRRSVRVFDFTFFLVLGLIGCIIAFLMFFSEHPATGYNLNFLVFNPLALLVSALALFRSKFVLDKYIYGILIVVFLVISFCSYQDMDTTMLILSCCVLVRLIVMIYVKKFLKR